jgi:hypothetical protein
MSQAAHQLKDRSLSRAGSSGSLRRWTFFGLDELWPCHWVVVFGTGFHGAFLCACESSMAAKLGLGMYPPLTELGARRGAVFFISIVFGEPSMG